MQKNWRELYQKIMTPAVVAALISGGISIIVSFDTNQKLEEIEEQKYTYDLQEQRYEKLQEFLNFFSEFKVFSTEYLYDFDLNNDEYSVNNANKTMHDSIDDFSSQLNLLVPYLSDEAIDLLELGGVLDEKTQFGRTHPRGGFDRSHSLCLRFLLSFRRKRGRSRPFDVRDHLFGRWRLLDRRRHLPWAGSLSEQKGRDGQNHRHLPAFSCQYHRLRRLHRPLRRRGGDRGIGERGPYFHEPSLGLNRGHRLLPRPHLMGLKGLR